MGFIEKEEQKRKENNKKLQEDREGERRTYQENQDRLRLQKTIEREEKKRLYRLRREAEMQFNASGLKTMLSRLKEARAIAMYVGGETHPSEGRPEEWWDRFQIKDGLFYTRVIVSNESRDVNGWEYVETERFFNITTDSIGLITFEYGSILPRHKEAKRSEWRENPNLLEDLLEKAFNSPRTIRTQGRHPPAHDLGGRGPCLPGNSPISTPNGTVLVKDFRVGNFVWTSDRFGHRVQTIIVKKTKRIVSKNHKMVHIILKDGRELVASLGHPTIGYKEIGSLVKGDVLDKTEVSSIDIVSYKDKYTYDILPYGDTGGYWTNNILIGSTLSDQFQRTILDGFRLSQVYTDLPHVIRSFPSRVIGVVPMYFLT